VSRPLPAPQTQLVHLTALDERHFVALFRDQAAATHPAPSYIEVLTRRGDWLGTFAIPVQIEQFQPTPFRYRFLATDAFDPTSLVIIDLKPYRVIRFALDMQPHLLAAAPWGYVAADARGQVEILDEFGQLVGRLELPFAPTALMPFDPYGLLIATWNETWGHLHVINLKTLEIQLLF
jgi:serine/threonine-protein kinase